jgi:lysophospholipase L1-like esterase
MRVGRIAPGRRAGAWRRLAIGCVVGIAACGGPASPTPPPPPPPDLSIVCPAAQSFVSPFGQPVTTSWGAPFVTGASDPATVSCWPLSGSAFATGATPVTCFVIDGAGRSATCRFNVTVERPPRLPVTRFVAFGDSLTEGKVTLASLPAVLLSLPQAYPVKLQDQLTARYLEQTFLVIDEGKGGERATQGVARLPDVLASRTPEVLLLQEGANDLLAMAGGAISGIVNSLDTMIKQAQGRGVRVFLANQPAQVAAGLRGSGAPWVVPLNDQIRALAQRDGVPLVDVYTPISLDPARTIGPDGLHLTERGYELMAQTFFDSIRTTLEIRSRR